MGEKLWEFNKGEWSEAYVFLKLLGSGRIYSADENGMKNLSVFIDILNVIRFEGSDTFTYYRKNEGDRVIIEAYRNDDIIIVKTAPELNETASRLYKFIMQAKSSQSKKNFTITEIQLFMEEFGFTSPKVPSIPQSKQDIYGKKADIVLTMKDSIDSSQSVEGFSIKSRLGSSPTLFNAAPASGLVYEVVGCTDELMHRVNIEDNFSTKMVPKIRELGLELRFIGTQPVNGVEVFRHNVMYVESTMAQILGYMMLIQTGLYDGKTYSMSEDIVRVLAEWNPLCFPNPELFYTSKVKDFHYASFSGMTATEPWDGKRRLSGGYIDVGKDGELLYYRAISDDIFCSYLFDHLFFDRPDRGYRKEIAVAEARAYFEGRELSSDERHNAEYTIRNGREVKRNIRCDWGYIYKKDDKYFLNINFQTRFR